ncbi:FAD-dependent oxidoreductase [Chloroflexota bacterium]
MARLKKLFQPIKFGSIELKNRVVMEPLAHIGYSKDDYVTDRLKGFYAERAKDGAGLIVIRISPLTDLGEPTPRGLGLYKDDFIPGLRELSDVIHHHDARAALQIGVDYMWSKGEGTPAELVGPSAVTPPRQPVPRELTVEEIQQIVEQFGDGARRAREAGFDAVEFHGFGDYLISRFLSPYTNKRTDSYGGNRQNRMRFLLEIIDSAKKKAGSDYNFACRLAGEDFMEGGITLEDTKVYAQMLEQAGIKLLDVGIGWPASPVPFIHMSVPRGAFVYLAEAVKKVVNVPVVAGTRINHPLLAEQVLAEGRADLIGMVRPFIADPEFLSKAKEGRFDDIRPCIACLYCYEPRPMTCSVNPRVGKETEYSIVPAAKPKNVLVIGGGPAGMEAAAIASQRGHRVTLWEKDSRLGGQLLLASVPPYKGEIEGLTRYLTNRVKKSGCRVRLGKKATAQMVEKLKPDAVIVATGAVATIPDIPGVDGNNVVTALDVLTLRRWVGSHVLVMGGGMIGCEVAEFLTEKGKMVTITTRQERIGHNIWARNRWVVMQRLKKASIRMETRVIPTRITDKGLEATQNGNPAFFETDTVVLAGGMEADNKLWQALQGRVADLYPIGDCTEPQWIAQAIEAGFRAGREV